MTISPESLRVYIVFRNLPEMTRAKGEVQAAHAAASLIYCGMKLHPSRIIQYMGEIDNFVHEGQPKIIMEAPDDTTFENVLGKVQERALPHVVVQDAAHTVFTKPTLTCIAFGPCVKTDGNAVTRGCVMRK